ncbi:gephyrin [Dendroctonus ponderosae]|uniref:MoaB/Mog domain-containing protein n=3 Tax=Dendroctonus ponderosae TaxID=77166 RepID=A0AAR5P405_DENPD|nr:gephyrin [Dendroctonus ponderosae]
MGDVKFGILTVSTSCHENPAKDLAGPKLATATAEAFPSSRITFKMIVTDSFPEIVNALKLATQPNVCDVLFTVGGTGFAPSDVTPEATRAVIEKEATGLSCALIAKSLAITDMAMLSRPACGIKNRTIIVNFPGSAKAAVECFGFIKTSILHAVALLNEQTDNVKWEHQRIQQESKVKLGSGGFLKRKSPFPMLEVDTALDLIRHQVAPIEESEEIAIENAATRILAEDIKAPHPIPSFPASIKDGYAVRQSDGMGRRRIRAAVAAGDVPDSEELQPGEIIRISTGAPVPAGADAVVQVEDTQLLETSETGDEDLVEILVAPKIGQDIRPIGSDIQAQSVVLKQHASITPAYIGVLAMLGISRVKVIKRPAIGIISTGNELVSFKGPLKPGLIYDSNKVMLLTLLKSFGYIADDCGIAKDTPNSSKSILENALKAHNFIISTGGVSMGEFDFLKQVLVEDFGAQVHFGRVNMKPGKPTVFATLNFEGKSKIVFALPGNPVSCFVTTLLFVLPTLKYLENDQQFIGWPTVDAILEEGIRSSDARPEYVRVIVSRNEQNTLICKSTGKQISSRLTSTVDANGLLLLPGRAAFEAGESHPVYLFGSIF